jgi:CPA1 family monovalent cation:H+ antiporter
VWDLLAYWAGSFIFVLAAILIPKLVPDLRPADYALILITAAAAFAARGIILFGLLPLLNVARLSPKVDTPYRLAILWGGLRGAVTLALALSVTESFGVPAEVKRQVGVVAVGFTLFTLVVQGITLRRVIGLLGLDRLSALDRALSDQVVAVALQSVRETVAETTRNLNLQPAIVRDKDRVTLGLVALAGHERDVVIEAFRDGLTEARLAERLLADADRLIEATRIEGRSGYRMMSKRRVRPGPAAKVAVWMHNRLGWSATLERITADRFEQLVTLTQVLRALHAFVDRRILRIHGRRVADLLHELLERRGDDIEKELEGLRLQFPGYAERLERRLIRSLTLMREAREYAQLTDDGLIGPELALALGAEVQAGRTSLARRPRLDLAVQKTDFVAKFPLFAEMPEEARMRLAARLRTVYAEPGEVLMQHNEVARGVWFIASGAVEMLQAGQVSRMGRGEMFGELGLLLRRARRARVTAITHCTLLALDEARFLDLVRTNAALRGFVEERARKRGVTLDASVFAGRPTRSVVAGLLDRLRKRTQPAE